MDGVLVEDRHSALIIITKILLVRVLVLVCRRRSDLRWLPSVVRLQVLSSHHLREIVWLVSNLVSVSPVVI